MPATRSQSCNINCVMLQTGLRGWHTPSMLTFAGLSTLFANTSEARLENSAMRSMDGFACADSRENRANDRTCCLIAGAAAAAAAQGQEGPEGRHPPLRTPGREADALQPASDRRGDRPEGAPTDRRPDDSWTPVAPPAAAVAPGALPSTRKQLLLLQLLCQPPHLRAPYFHLVLTPGRPTSSSSIARAGPSQCLPQKPQQQGRVVLGSRVRAEAAPATAYNLAAGPHLCGS